MGFIASGVVKGTLSLLGKLLVETEIKKHFLRKNNIEKRLLTSIDNSLKRQIKLSDPEIQKVLSEAREVILANSSMITGLMDFNDPTDIMTNHNTQREIAKKLGVDLDSVGNSTMVGTQIGQALVNFYLDECTILLDSKQLDQLILKTLGQLVREHNNFVQQVDDHILSEHAEHKITHEKLDDIMKAIKKSLPLFKAHSGQLYEKNGQVITDDVFCRNIGESLASDVKIHFYPDYFISMQEAVLIGDVAPYGEIKISKILDSIQRIRNRMEELSDVTKLHREKIKYINNFSHNICILIQFKDLEGNEYLQTCYWSLSWYQENKGNFQVSVSGDASLVKKISNTGYDIEQIDRLIACWKRDFEQNDSLENVAKEARELAWRIYQSGCKNADDLVRNLFKVCQDAENIHHALCIEDKVKDILSQPDYIDLTFPQIKELHPDTLMDKLYKYQHYLDALMRAVNSLDLNPLFINKELSDKLFKMKIALEKTPVIKHGGWIKTNWNIYSNFE
jgi:hypothetical protein